MAGFNESEGMVMNLQDWQFTWKLLESAVISSNFPSISEMIGV
jgi:hypothetical protein